MAKKILIIEDDNTLRGLIVQKMKGELYNVIDSADAFETYTILDKYIFDAIILDIMLPEIDGYEILRKIREHPMNSAVPVLVFSNLSDEVRIEKALKLGANNFFVKTSLSLDELAEQVKKIVEH